MNLRTEDLALVRIIEDAIMEELDRQHLNNEIGEDSTGAASFDAVDGEIVGRPDFFKVATAALQAYWSEEGR